MLFSGKDGKECRLCGEWKKYSEFSKRKEAKDGYRTECKSCRSSRNGEYNRKIKQKSTMTTLIIPDLQAPFHHEDALHFLKSVRDEFLPDEVVCIGDEFDFYWLSDYGTDPDFDNPEGEYYKARAFWQSLFKEFPKGVGVHSNHVKGRLDRKRKSAKLPTHFLRSLEEIIGAPEGWKWVDEYITQGTVCRHGHADGKSAKVNLEKINHFNLFTDAKPYNLCLGHHHTLIGSTDVPMGQHVAWMAFSGSLIDRKAHAFRYTNKPPMLGCGMIRDGRFFPVIMKLDKNNRWVGEL